MSANDRLRILREQAKRRKRANLISNVLLAVLGLPLAAAVIFGIFAIGAGAFLLAWNNGVVGVAQALGQHAQTISFWTALGGSFACGVIGRTLRGTGGATLNHKKD